MDPAQGEALAAVAVGEQTKVANLDEARGQDVKQEPADELDGIEGHDCTVVVMSQSLQRKPTRPFSMSRDSVGNCHTARVASQILQRVFGAAEGGLEQTTHSFLRKAAKESEIPAAERAQPEYRRSIVHCGDSSA